WMGWLRLHRTIFQEGDTNMLIEAYHHVLKSTWLDGKRNRRVDHLLHTLVENMLPTYENRYHRHRRQGLGFEGPNLADARCAEIMK
ncbi:hypothetical protein BC834DRAFT_783524, partial [Gloeopeniophorella convolvens]